MEEREQLHELHLALEGAVDQLARAHRLAIGRVDGEPLPESARIDHLYGEAAALRNQVRDRLLGLLGRAPTIGAVGGAPRDGDDGDGGGVSPGGGHGAPGGGSGSRGSRS